MKGSAMSDDLVTRLRKVGYLNSDNGDWGLRNPDGHEAAARIEALTEALSIMVTVFAGYADSAAKLEAIGIARAEIAKIDAQQGKNND
jgi:hypothetical protein